MFRVSNIIIFTAITAGIMACTADASNKKSASPVIPVTVTKVRMADASIYNAYPGNAVALKSVELRGQVGGYLTGMYFTEGSEVREGQKLYEIDRRKYQAALNESTANLRIAEENLSKVQRDADRYSDLARQDAVAKQLYDNSVTDLNNAKHRLDAAKSQLINATADYEYSVINAPFTGTIGFSGVKLGALITAGQTLLNTISSDDPMGIDFDINEMELMRFQELQRAVQQKNDTTFRIILPDNSLYSYGGKISVIDRAVNAQTGTIRVRLTVPNPERVLKPGMSCKIRVLDKNTGRHMIIPYKAVVEQLGEYFVYKVEGSIVKQVKVVLGPSLGTDVIVLEGLTGDETIVVEGIQKLNDGSEISVGSSQN
jgi:membrane fusion protein (multidrug efflux system)